MEHVPIARLLIVAINDLIFTTEEFTHLKECPECFDEWSAFVKAVETQEKLQAEEHYRPRVKGEVPKSGNLGPGPLWTE